MSIKHPYAFWGNLKMVYSFIFEDLELDQKPEEQINFVLRNENEINVINPVVKALDIVYSKIGPLQDNDSYLNSSLWNDVVEHAKVAYEYIKNQGLDNDYISITDR